MNPTAASTPIPKPASAHRPPSVFRLALRQGWRDLRGGELRLLGLALVLAVAALTAVTFFADRLQAGLQRDARALVGGDAVVAADRPLPTEFSQPASEAGLRVARTVSFPSMARAPESRGGDARLSAVKAVDGAYPLRGQLTVSAPAGSAGAPEALKRGPAPGRVWVDPGLLDALGLALGDRLLLGDADFLIERTIVQEPDRGAGFMSFSPRVMLHLDDLAATGLVQPTSRVTWRLLVAAAPETSRREAELRVRGFVEAVNGRVEREGLRGIRIEATDDGRPEMQQTLARAEKFLKMVALLTALLAAVAVGIGARDFSQRRLDDCALMRVMGLSQRRMSAVFALEFLGVGLAAGLIGVGLGWALHHGFIWLLAGLVRVALPEPALWPAFFGLGVGLVLLMAFGWPPVLQLAAVPPLRVIRRDLGLPRAGSALVLLAGTAGFAALLVAVAADWTLGALAVGGFAVAVGLFAGLAWLAVGALRRALPTLQGSGAGGRALVPRWLLLATRQLAARPAFVVLQVSALSVGLLALVLLVLLRTDLISSWRQATPANAPNRFVINLQPEQGEDFRQRLAQAGVRDPDWYPMIRGRLVAINDQPVRPEDGRGERAQRLLDREFNLSHSAELPAHNQVVAGRWVPEEREGLSVEEGLAQTLGLKLGDTLRFDIAGQAVQARITSLRKVDWGSMRVNFFVLFPQADLSELPRSFISAFRAPGGASDAPAAKALDRQLAREFPNLTLIDVSASVAQVQQVLDQVIRAVEFLFAFTLAAGLVVLLAAVSATREGRVREVAVMRALGAGHALLRRMQQAELLGLGALAGFLASVAAMALGWALARFVFEFAWTPALWVPLAGSASGAVLAWAAGWWSLREVLTRPVVDSLRRAE